MPVKGSWIVVSGAGNGVGPCVAVYGKAIGASVDLTKSEAEPTLPAAREARASACNLPRLLGAVAALYPRSPC